jgi:hypothetical protein
MALIGADDGGAKQQPKTAQTKPLTRRYSVCSRDGAMAQLLQGDLVALHT